MKRSPRLLARVCVATGLLLAAAIAVAAPCAHVQQGVEFPSGIRLQSSSCDGTAACTTSDDGGMVRINAASGNLELCAYNSGTEAYDWKEVGSGTALSTQEAQSIAHCSGHGNYDAEAAACECHRSAANGHWKGIHCEECDTGYIGADCATASELVENVCADGEIGETGTETCVSTLSGSAPSISALPCQHLNFRGSSGSICAESKTHSCYSPETWAGAFALCTSLGARLCSATEIGTGVGSSLGCSTSGADLWTSEACSGGHVLLQSGTTTQCTASETKARFFCCADQYPAASLEWFSHRQVVQSLDASSVESCVSLDWHNDYNQGLRSVCAETADIDEPRRATDALTFTVANRLCQSNGGRLCSLNEVLEPRKEPYLSGGTESVRIWTSTPCYDDSGEYYYTTIADGRGSTQCASVLDTYASRCCADYCSDVDSATQAQLQSGGSGSDGPLVVDSPQSGGINALAALIADAPRGSETLEVTTTDGFAAGDEILVLQVQTAHIRTQVQAGQYEFATVLSVSGSTTLQLAAPLLRSYASGRFDVIDSSVTQVLRVPHFSTATISSPLTLPAWNGTVGGVLAARISGDLLMSGAGVINADGAGFRGGIYGPNNGDPGSTGEGWRGLGQYDYVNNPAVADPADGGGGGGGSLTSAGGSGAAGGSHATQGELGTHGSSSAAAKQSGLPGSAYGTHSMFRIYFGGGGGGGGDGDNFGHDDNGNGGAGGGIVMLMVGGSAQDVAISADGAQGCHSEYLGCRDVPPSSFGCGPAVGGSGAGGSILLHAGGTVSLSAVSAVGGVRNEHGTDCAGDGGSNDPYGGAGGDGRIRIDYGGSVTGSSTPTAAFVWNMASEICDHRSHYLSSIA